MSKKKVNVRRHLRKVGRRIVPVKRHKRRIKKNRYASDSVKDVLGKIDNTRNKLFKFIRTVEYDKKSGRRITKNRKKRYEEAKQLYEMLGGMRDEYLDKLSKKQKKKFKKTETKFPKYVKFRAIKKGIGSVDVDKIVKEKKLEDLPEDKFGITYKVKDEERGESAKVPDARDAMSQMLHDSKFGVIKGKEKEKKLTKEEEEDRVGKIIDNMWKEIRGSSFIEDED